MSTYSISLLTREREKDEVLVAIDAEVVEAERTAALSEEHLVLFVEAFQALADLTCARILSALTHRPFCVRDLASLVEVSESAVSHQLRFVLDRRLVTARHRASDAGFSDGRNTKGTCEDGTARY